MHASAAARGAAVDAARARRHCSGGSAKAEAARSDAGLALAGKGWERVLVKGQGSELGCYERRDERKEERKEGRKEEKKGRKKERKGRKGRKAKRAKARRKKEMKKMKKSSEWINQGRRRGGRRGETETHRESDREGERERERERERDGDKQGVGRRILSIRTLLERNKFDEAYVFVVGASQGHIRLPSFALLRAIGDAELESRNRRSTCVNHYGFRK